MGRRIEVELTSSRDDGSWTWRAAGAREPKGELLGTLLYEGAKVGDVCKAEAEFHVDGIEITEVFAPKKKKDRANILEMKSRPLRDDELVTAQRVSGGRKGGKGRNRDRDRGGDQNRERRGNRENRPPRPQPSALSRPKPKRINAKRVHRNALLEATPEEHRPIVEQVIRDGMPGVRAAIKKQNEEAKAAGKPEIDDAPILAIAEKNLQKARLAEWRDRADAALAIGSELDLRDLRSVVVAGNDLARDDETRALAEQLRKTLDDRIESDHGQWLGDLEEAIEQGRVVRALRLSSRPVKAGAPLPSELATTLAGQAAAALADDIAQDRWATVLDALAFSPVRGAVVPAGLPASPGEELLDAVKRLSDRVPSIAQLFGIDPATVPRSAKRRRGGRKGERPASKPKNTNANPKPREDSNNAEASNTKAPAKPESEAPAADVVVPVEATTDTEVSSTEAPAPEATSEDAASTAETPAEETTAAEEATPAEEAADTAAADAAAEESDSTEATPAEEAADTAAADAGAEESDSAEETPAE